MNYNSPQLIDQLAAAYVLGTLRGPARRRFFQLAASNVNARQAVIHWENRLAPLATELRPLAPPEQVWERIEQRLNFKKPAVKRDAGWWPAMAAALALVAVGISAYFMTREPQVRVETRVQVRVSEPQYVAVVTDKDARPLWLLSVYSEQKQLRVAAVNAHPLETGKDYELWMVPKDGTAPVSLGVIPAGGEKQLPLSERQQAVLAGSEVLAVSLEPAGGSPTGAPTGPVLWTAPVVRAAG